MGHMFGGVAVYLTPVVALLGSATALQAQATSWYDNNALATFGASTASVWGTSTSDMWLTGGLQATQHFDGTSWTTPTTGGVLNRYTVWGFQAGQAFTAGQNGYQSGAIQSCTPTSCTTIYTAETELVGLWGRSPNDLYTSGDGIVRHFDGASWIDLPTGLSTAFNTNRLESISGGATRTFFAGRNGVILSYDGTTLQQMSTGSNANFNGVFALSDNLAWAVGSSGTIFQWNGSSWAAMESNTTQDLNGVFALSATSAYATGANGTVLYWNGISWAPVDIGKNGVLDTPFGLSEAEVFIPVANGQYGEVVSSTSALGGRLLVSTVPEPSTVFLVVTGLVGITFAQRRQAKIRQS